MSMDRREFLKNSAIGSAGLLGVATGCISRDRPKPRKVDLQALIESPKLYEGDYISTRGHPESFAREDDLGTDIIYYKLHTKPSKESPFALARSREGVEFTDIDSIVYAIGDVHLSEESEKPFIEAMPYRGRMGMVEA